MDMLTTVFKNAKARSAIIYIGGVDPAKYDTASGFNQYFRKNADPNEAEIVPLSDIIDYQTEPDGRGYLNIEVKVRSKFSIPTSVFSNYSGSNSGSSLTYYIDTKGFSNNFSGDRSFASQPNITHFLLKGVESIPQQWNGFSGTLPRVLDFESALTLTIRSFHDYRTPNDRINVRNANDIDVADYSDDDVFVNYNLNLVPEPLKVIYVHKDLETINNGGILDSLQDCINRNADVRFIDPSNVGLIVNTPVNTQVSNYGATWVEFSFTDISNADFYEVWVENFNGLIEQYFPISEITNSNKIISGLDPDRNYRFQLVARDVHYNDSIKSIATPQITTLTEDIITIAETNVGGTYVEFDITNPSPYTINAVEVYVGGTLITDYQLDGLSVLMYNLIEQTSYNIDIIAKTNENIDLISNTINVTTQSNDITITEITTGGTYVEFSIGNTTSFTITEVEVYVGGVLNTISNKYAVNLNELTSYNIDVIAKTSEEANLISNTINVTTTTIPALFQNAVAYYKSDETSGDAIDVVNGYNGTLIGGVTQGVAGKVGNAYSFDGVNGYINVPDLDNKIGTNDFTISCWFQTTQTSAFRLIQNRGNGALGATLGFMMRIDPPAGNYYAFCLDDGVGNFIDFGDVNINELDGNWHLICLRWKNTEGKLTLCIDGQVKSEKTNTNMIGKNYNNDSFEIGRSSGGNQHYNGDMDEVSVILEALTDGEISDLYNNGNGVTI